MRASLAPVAVGPMKFNCVHVFQLEAEDWDDFDEKLARYSAKVHRASEKLDIGYGGGLMTGRPASDRYETRQAEPEGLLERLFE